MNEFQKWTESIALYPSNNSATNGSKLAFSALGLASEAGEVIEKVKKVWRDRNLEFDVEDIYKIARELGDVLFGVACVASNLGFKLSEIADESYAKMESRKGRGVLRGEGDNR